MTEKHTAAVFLLQPIHHNLRTVTGEEFYTMLLEDTLRDGRTHQLTRITKHTEELHLTTSTTGKERKRKAANPLL